MNQVGFLKPLEVQAAYRGTLTLDTAVSNAIRKSGKMENLDVKLLAKQAALKSALKSIKAKQKNLSTFRWSPLLSFKFPQSPNQTQSYEFQFKPLKCQMEIDQVYHMMEDQKLEIKENISNLYVDVVVRQDMINFSNDKLDALKKKTEKDKARLATGGSTKAQIESQEKKATTLNDRIAADTRALEAAKKKLSEAIGMDVNTGYDFETPFQEAEIPRSALPKLIQYALDRSQTMYDAKLRENLAYQTLNLNYNLFRNHYKGSDMGIISSYCQQALRGEKVNAKAFKSSYDRFVEKIDSYWNKSITIIFFTFSFEFFKGSLDGTRYIEDDPYVLYTNAMEYLESITERNNTSKELTQQITDAFNNYVSVRNTYNNYTKQLEDMEKNVDKSRLLNVQGLMTLEEYTDLTDEFEQLQKDTFDSLAEYTKTLNSLDRLTCGGVSAFLSGTDADLGLAAGGEAMVEPEIAQGAHYYINPIVADQQFRLGVSFPANYDTKVTHFELWSGDTMIGKRTPITGTIRHLAISKKDVDEVKLRFYNNNDFVSDVTIDADSWSGPLDLVKGYNTEVKPNTTIGTYKIEKSDVSGIVTITLTPNEEEGIHFYKIKDQNDNYLISEDNIPITNNFKYLGLAEADLPQLTLECYGEDEALLYKAFFDTAHSNIVKEPEG